MAHPQLDLVAPPHAVDDAQDTVRVTIDLVARAHARVAVAGDLDHGSAPVLDAVWRTVIASSPARVTVDLSDVQFCNAAGLRSLAAAADACSERGWALRMVVQPWLARLFNIVGLDTVLAANCSLEVTAGPDGSTPRSQEAPRPALRSVPTPEAPSGLVQRVSGAVAWARTLARTDLADTVTAVAATALDTIAGADSVDLILMGARRIATSAGSQGPLGSRLSELEAQLRQGPSWHSCAREVDVFVADLRDASTHLRWPHLLPAAGALPVRSVMSLHLATPGRSLGALIITSTQPHTFDDEDRGIARTLAAVASLSIAAAVDHQQLTQALLSRDVIGQAKGILMERHRLTAEQAFDLLRTASVHRNTKLRTIAAHVAETGEI